MIDSNTQIGEGAEQKVYMNTENQTVIKTNDSIFFIFWVDYLNNLLIHNYFFPATLYTLQGFKMSDNNLYAVVEQPFIRSEELVDLNNVKELLKENVFINKKNNDYFNPQLGIILEDLHDENVLQNNGIPYFIDTVFYLTPDFYSLIT